MIRLFTEQRRFNYEKPIMKYDKETGEVTIKEVKKEKRIIESVDEDYKERMKLHKELGLDEKGQPLEENLKEEDVENLAERLKKAAAAIDHEAEADPF
jgi:aldehyde:ferredoxin oxidoreductase